MVRGAGHFHRGKKVNADAADLDGNSADKNRGLNAMPLILSVAICHICGIVVHLLLVRQS